MNKKFKKLLILILVLAIATFGVYAFFISSPQKIFKGFLTGKDDDEAIAKKDNINGVYLRTEALEIRLTGELANKYDVYYRIRVENQSNWQDWTKNGGEAGSSGKGLKLEAIQIMIYESLIQYQKSLLVL